MPVAPAEEPYHHPVGRRLRSMVGHSGLSGYFLWHCMHIPLAVIVYFSKSPPATVNLL
jgi:hypothetical protein